MPEKEINKGVIESFFHFSHAVTEGHGADADENQDSGDDDGKKMGKQSDENPRHDKAYADGHEKPPVSFLFLSVTTGSS